MDCSIVIDKLQKKLKVNADLYDVNKISNVQVTTLTIKDKIINILLLGFTTSSILFYFIPTEAQGKGVTLLLPAVAFLVGALIPLFTSAKYVFRLEFKHSDETGVQWITVAKTRKMQEYEYFKQQEAELKQLLSS